MSDKPIRIAVIAGDGIGPEVIEAALRVLAVVQQQAGLRIELRSYDLGANRFLRDGVTFPDDVRLAIEQHADAVFLGALGDPRVPDSRHARDILFGLRFGLDLYCNVRPVQCLDDRLMPLKGFSARDCDFVVFRENTEGIYAGIGGQLKRGTPDEVAINEDINTRKGVERIIRAAFAHARAHGRTRLCMADKSNAMQHAHSLWQRVFKEVASEYADVEARHLYIDALCLALVQDPSQFQVIVTNNLFGDIVTDLAAALQGGLGMAASANLHPGRRPSLYEPVHGSAPDIAGQGVANPFAAVLTLGLLLSDAGHPELELRLREAVSAAVRKGECTRDVGGRLSTSAATDALISLLSV